HHPARPFLKLKVRLKSVEQRRREAAIEQSDQPTLGAQRPCGPFANDEELSALRIGAAVQDTFADASRSACHRARVLPESLGGSGIARKIRAQELDDHRSVEGRIERFPEHALGIDAQLANALVSRADQ